MIKSIQLIDVTLTYTTILVPIEPGNDSEEVVCIPKSYRTRVSQLDSLVLHLEHSLAEMHFHSITHELKRMKKTLIYRITYFSLLYFLQYLSSFLVSPDVRAW